MHHDGWMLPDVWPLHPLRATDQQTMTRTPPSVLCFWLIAAALAVAGIAGGVWEWIGG